MELQKLDDKALSLPQTVAYFPLPMRYMVKDDSICRRWSNTLAHENIIVGPEAGFPAVGYVPTRVCKLG